MSDDAPTTGSSDSEAVAELLRQLVDARFVLTDRDGAITRWSRPAEDLFGWPAARMLGRSLVETLGLRASLPAGGGQLTTVAQRRDGHVVEVALGLVPVRMNESLEFNGFLEALEFAAPRGDALAQLGRSHSTVLDWIHAALQGDARLDDVGLAAGTIVTFRSLDEPPNAAAPELEEDGLATDIERILENVAAELDETREVAEAARGEAAQAKERLTGLERDEAGLESELAGIRSQLETLRGELGQTRSGALAALERLDAELAESRDEVSARVAAAQQAQATIERLAGRAEEAARAADDDSAGAKDAAAAADARATRAESAADVEDHVRRMAEAADAAGRQAAEAQHAAAGAVAAAELARRSAEEADRLTRAAEEAARGRAYEAPAALRRFHGRHTALRDNGSARPSQREPRPGFDDAGHPMATTELNGSFRELNQPFSELVGYSEADFRAAVWPPVMDRANLPKHREQMELLLEGRIDSADFNTGYVHAQGLLVPLAGTITLVEEAGKPDHFLLSVDAQS